MTRLLANKNVPGDVVVALRGDNHDVAWMSEVSPGSRDEAFLALAVTERACW